MCYRSGNPNVCQVSAHVLSFHSARIFLYFCMCSQMYTSGVAASPCHLYFRDHAMIAISGINAFGNGMRRVGRFVTVALPEPTFTNLYI